MSEICFLPPKVISRRTNFDEETIELIFKRWKEEYKTKEAIREFTEFVAYHEGRTPQGKSLIKLIKIFENHCFDCVATIQEDWKKYIAELLNSYYTGEGEDYIVRFSDIIRREKERVKSTFEILEKMRNPVLDFLKKNSDTLNAENLRKIFMLSNSDEVNSMLTICHSVLNTGTDTYADVDIQAENDGISGDDMDDEYDTDIFCQELQIMELHHNDDLGKICKWLYLHPTYTFFFNETSEAIPIKAILRKIKK
jgi:hypothetical protein